MQIVLANRFVKEKPPPQSIFVTAGWRAVHQAEEPWKLMNIVRYKVKGQKKIQDHVSRQTDVEFSLTCSSSLAPLQILGV